MADIAYTRAFRHDPDYIDNESVVEAGGPNGFNTKFHALEAEFDRLAAVVAAVNDAIKATQRVRFVVAQAPIALPALTASAEFDVETYDRTGLDANVEKVYYAVVLPTAGPTHVQHTFLYRNAGAGRVQVKVQFFNPANAPAGFGFRVMTLAAQS